jgi:hypothetical protein
MERAERLIAQGEYRAAIAALSVQLEQGLRRLAVSKLPDPSLTQRSQRLGISRLAKLLTDADVITETDARELRHLGSLRSKAIHETAEPSEEDARMMRDFVETFTRKRFRRA